MDTNSQYENIKQKISRSDVCRTAMSLSHEIRCFILLCIVTSESKLTAGDIIDCLRQSENLKDLSEQTIRTQLNELVRYGMVETITARRPKKYQLSLFGKEHLRELAEMLDYFIRRLEMYE